MGKCIISKTYGELRMNVASYDEMRISTVKCDCCIARALAVVWSDVFACNKCN